jgi:hypothetical protein
MFLVEAEAGRRCQYRSAGALGAAIQRGELGPQARIFHRTAQRWLPITVHPEYRKVESAREAVNSQWREWEFTFLASRPTAETQAELFRPIPAQPPSTVVLIPPEPERSWLGSAFRQVRRLARLG